MSSAVTGTTGGGSGWTPPSVEDLQQLLPQYEIESMVGHGGMGAVYKGKQAALQRPVAIKVLPETLISGDDDHQYVERFKLEARAMANLDHPAIISVFDFGQTTAGHLYFVMEFIDGMDIEQYIIGSGGKVDPEHAVAIVSHVLDALDYAHSQGIVHRDIKPANVLISAAGRVKIADFGLAKEFGGEDAAELSGLTMTNMAVGTPDYIAPEALEIGAGPDHRADLYAVGVMFFKMLTGKLPRGMFKLPSEQISGLDERFDEIIALAMESDPEERFQNASEFRYKLDELQSAPVTRIEPQQDSDAVSPAVSGLVLRNLENPVEPGSRDKASPRPKREIKSAIVVGSIIVAITVIGLVSLNFVGNDDLPISTNEPVVEPDTSLPPSAPPTVGEREINLLAATEPKVDSRRGIWVKAEGSLQRTNDQGPSTIRLSHAAPENYLFRAAFSLKDEGPDVVFVIPVGDTRTTVALGGARAAENGPVSGISNVDGKPAIKNETAVFQHNLETGITHQVEIKVLNKSEDAYIDVTLNGDRLIEWTGKRAALGGSISWLEAEEPNSPFLYLHHFPGSAAARFNRLTLEALPLSATLPVIAHPPIRSR